MEPILDNEQLDIQSPRARGSHLMIKLMHIERENANMQKKIIELEQYI